MVESCTLFKLHSFQMLSLASYCQSERLVAAGTLTECSTGGDKRVCDGAVTKTLKSSTPSVQVCDMGKLKVKNVQQVGKGAPTPGGGQRHNCCILHCHNITIFFPECEWYGQLYCSGDIIIDLYSWKFLKKCADGKMGIYGRSWQEVAQDPRFKVIIWQCQQTTFISFFVRMMSEELERNCDVNKIMINLVFNLEINFHLGQNAF